MRSNRMIFIMITVLLAVFALGVLRLFKLRFAAGDVYPPYSSLRADPLGCRALYESIDALPDFNAQRNFQPLSKLADNAPRALFFLGCEERDLVFVSKEEAHELDALLWSGNRLVVTLLPASTNPPPPKVAKHVSERKSQKRKDREKKEDTQKDEPPKSAELVSLKKRWNFDLNYTAAATNELWHSTLYFDKLDPKWRTLVTRGKYPAVIERNFGHGTIVLCADSYFVSNEALRHDRQPDLLAQLLGPHHDVLFDEVHLGTVDNPGLMTLARVYRLHGLLAGLVVLAGLFVWQNAVSFVPTHAERDDNIVTAAGKDSAAGFVNLLRRSIPASQVLGVCLNEWKKSFAHKFRRAPAKLEQVQSIVTTRPRDPIGGYHSIAGILKERK